jgi:fructose-bisphosphate aldolase, class II
MTPARLTEVLAPAAASGTGLGAFNVFSIEHAEAFTAAAEAAGRPVVLEISQNAVRYHSALAPIGLATLALARKGTVPMVVHLDHVTDESLVEEAVSLGFGSVMFDASTMPYANNVASTAAIVRRCHDSGIDVEAELGEIGGKDAYTVLVCALAPTRRPTLSKQPGVDALAVAVGSSHAMAEHHVVDSRRYLGPARETVAAEAARLLRLLNLQAAGSAAH